MTANKRPSYREECREDGPHVNLRAMNAHGLWRNFLSVRGSVQESAASKQYAAMEHPPEINYKGRKSFLCGAAVKSLPSFDLVPD